MGRVAAWVSGLLGSLLLLAPQSATVGSLALTVILAAVLVAVIVCAQVRPPVAAVARARQRERSSYEEMRQYEPARAGRPQPRAPGNGR